MSVRFLVTGAQGFIGRYVAADLLTSRATAHVAGVGRSPLRPDTFTHSLRWTGGRLPAPLPQELERALSDERYSYAAIDVVDRARLREHLATVRPDVIIHLASGLRDDDASHLFRTNVEGTLALVEAIAEASIRVRRLIVCSTGAVYGAPGDASLPFEEDAPCRPVDPYGVSKLVAEHVSRIAAGRHGIATVWARLFNVVGAGEDDRHVGPQLACQAAEIAHGIRAPVVEIGDAAATRDFIDVRDAAHALAALADAGAPGATYNVATGREASVGSLLAAILDAAGLEAVDIRRRSVPAAAVRRHVADTRRLRALGVVPRFSLADSARDMVRYYVDRVASAAVLQPLG